MTTASTVPRQIVITLVHGTWAPKAPWTLPGSKLREELEAQLAAKGATVEYCRFDWSGANQHNERRAAAACLRRQLVRQLAQSPSAKHFVVAHSHGANVALKAIGRSAQLRKDIAGVVSIAAPFLRFERQKPFLVLLPLMIREALAYLRELISDYGDLVVAVGLVSGVLGAVYLLAAFIIERLFSITIFPSDLQAGFESMLGGACAWAISPGACRAIGTTLMVFMALLVGVGCCGQFLASGWDRARRKHGRALVAARRSIFRRYSYSQPERLLQAVPQLALSSVVDEALAALSGSWWLHRTSGWAARAAAGLALTVAIAAFCASLYGLYMAEQMLREYRYLHPVLTSDLAGLIVLVLSGTVLLVLMAMFARVLLAGAARFSNLGSALESPSTNLLWSVRAYRHVPESGCEHRRYGVAELILGTRAPLFHSRLYSYSPAIDYVAQWIHARDVSLALLRPSARPAYSARRRI